MPTAKSRFAVFAICVLSLTSISAARVGALRQATYCIRNNAYVSQLASCANGDIEYELEWTDGNGLNDYGPADEGVACTVQHETCSTGCPVQNAMIIAPPAPAFGIDDFEGDVYWDMYNEQYVGPQDCSNSCTNGYTDEVETVSGDEIDAYYFPCVE